MMWRLEPHRNGKPHYHCIVWSYRKKIKIWSEYYARKIRKAWRNAIDQHDRAAELYSCKIEKLGSHKKAMQYVSKYVAKEDDARGQKIDGRRWGTSSSLPVGAISEVNLTRDQYKRLKDIIRVILKSKNKPSGLIKAILGSTKMMWTWLSPDEIVAVLDYLGLPPPINQYKNYRKCGNALGTMNEMAQIAADHGYSF